MTPTQAQELLRSLRTKPRSLDELQERVKTAGSLWSTDQLRLFLLSARGVAYDADSATYRAVEEDGETALQDAIIEAVRSFAGRPAAVAQVRSRLPSHFITTDEQVVAVARRTSGIEVFGPRLLRLAR